MQLIVDRYLDVVIEERSVENVVEALVRVGELVHHLVVPMQNDLNLDT